MSDQIFAYYPGCSGLGSSREYDTSTRSVCAGLGIDLVDIPDWNCCGSTPAHAVNHLLSSSLSARNICIAEEMGAAGIVTPCPSCLKNLKTVQRRMQNADFHEKVQAIISRQVGIDLPVKSVLQVIMEEVSTAQLVEMAGAPLQGLKVVPYYGCLMNRPPDIMGFDDPENPMALDNLLSSMGAEVLPFPMKVECCGGSLGVPRQDIVTRLSGKILDMAAESGAHAMVTACPMCQMNLDMRQSQINRANGSHHRMPIFYYTQLMGLAAGQSMKSLGMDKLCVSPEPALHAMISNVEART